MHSKAGIESMIARLARTIPNANQTHIIHKTIKPTDRLFAHISPEQIVATLPTLEFDSQHSGEFLIKGSIGQGGMGVVMLALQTGLGRDVAVKSLKGGLVDSSQLQMILQEAWITGWLEHPNIVPIYTLGKDAQNNPLIVMKCVEGQVWSDHIHALDKDAESKELDWHLDILIQVCRAMEYAHDRGIVHRDLKPDNIMIGQFGEVYVLDWGIAVSLYEDLEGRLPLARDARTSAGTPVYMSPEAVLAEAPPDERSDIYLLGAILHELLTGQPPHMASHINGVFVRAVASAAKQFDASVPAELASICNKAMHRDRRMRYQRVEDFRLALASYLKHRSSIELTNHAHSRLDVLRKYIEQEQLDQVERFYGECFFGYEQALWSWPQNERAQQGLSACLLLKLNHDIKQDNVLSAQHIMNYLRQSTWFDVAQLLPYEQQLRDVQSAQQQAYHVVKDYDFSVGAKAKLSMLVMLAVLWSGVPCFIGYRQNAGLFAFNSTNYLLGSIRIFSIALVVLVVFRKMFLLNAANRRLALGLLTFPLCIVLMRGLAIFNSLELTSMLVVEVSLYVLFLIHLALTTHVRLLVGALGFAVASLAMSAFPQYDDYIIGLTNFVVVMFTLYVWQTTRLSRSRFVM